MHTIQKYKSTKGGRGQQPIYVYLQFCNRNVDVTCICKFVQSWMKGNCFLHQHQCEMHNERIFYMRAKYWRPPPPPPHISSISNLMKLTTAGLANFSCWTGVGFWRLLSFRLATSNSCHEPSMWDKPRILNFFVDRSWCPALWVFLRTTPLTVLVHPRYIMNAWSPPAFSFSVSQ